MALDLTPAARILPAAARDALLAMGQTQREALEELRFRVGQAATAVFLGRESVLRGRSYCDVCGHVLAARDLVPVFSYLFSRGRCRYCGAKLSPRHV